MADTNPSTSGSAAPPGGGRQDHDSMRDAAMRPVVGPAGSGTLAAGGGLEVPGREAHPELATRTRDTGDRHELIPGERDATTLTHREPGAIGVPIGGQEIGSPRETSLDDRTAYEHAREGGGAAARKPQQTRQG